MSKIASAVRSAPNGPAASVATDDPPFITSSVNGMVVPLLPHQGGILHRFKRAGNPIVVDALHGAAAPDDREGRAIIIESEHPEGERADAPAAPAVPSAPSAPAPKAKREPAKAMAEVAPDAPLL